MAYEDPQVYNTTQHDGAGGSAAAPDLSNPYVQNATLAGAAPALLSDVDARQYVLDRIASGEATRYNELFGGGSFNSYDSHPNIHIPIPGRPGWTSSAAGRYQFITPTWQAEANKLGLKDFGPKNQDAAAWDLAQTTYKQQTGRDLIADAKERNVNWSALGGQWASLAGKSGTLSEHPTPAQRAAEGSSASAGGGPAGGPAGGASTKRLLALMMLQSSLNNVRLQPVDYNPFALMPKF